MTSMPQTAVILAGGPASAKGFLGVPLKSLLPIGNRPLVEYIATVLSAVGVKRLLISLDASATEAAHQLDTLFRTSPLSLACVIQETVPGTGGSLKELEDRLHDGTFWVISADVFLNADLNQMLTFHQEHQKIATVGAVQIQPSPFELERIEVDVDQHVKAIHRFHPTQNKRSMLRPAGLYLFETEILNYIPQGSYFDLQEQLFSLLAERKTPAAVWKVEGYCLRIFSPADYLAANRDILLKRVQSLRREDLALPEMAGSPRPEVSSTAILVDPFMIGLASRVHAGAMIIGPTVIGDHCEVEEDAILDECVVMANARIGRGARLNHCIVGKGAQVEDGAVFRETIVLGQPAKINDMTVPPGNFVPLDPSSPPVPSRVYGGMRQVYLLGKRFFDLVVATLALVALSPVMLLVALAVKLDSAGPIIFRQTRCGRGGRAFTMYKFRSMVVNADELKRELSLNNEVDGPMFKITDDPRITRIGRILRATNLDEVPQFWNVLRGDMSLVGPRPLSMDEMRYNPSWRDLRLSVAPGLTGLWQVEGHSKTSFADWIKYDIHYVRNMSPWLDLMIMIKTLLKSSGVGPGQAARKQTDEHA